MLPAHIGRTTTRDPDEYRSWFVSRYADHDRRIRPESDGFGLTAEFGSLGGLSVTKTRYREVVAEVHWASPPQVYVSHLLSGRYRMRWAGGELRLTDRGLLLHPPSDYAFESFSSDNRILGLDLGTVLRTGEELTGLDRQAIRFTGLEPISAAAERQWMATATYIRRGIYELHIRHPLLLLAAEQMVAVSLLSTFPNTTMTDETRRRHGWCAPAPVRRAVAFIDGAAERPISLTDIAAAAGLSVVVLEEAFQRHRGSGMAEYLRSVRLARAHDRLVAAEPGASVPDVAAALGFTAGEFEEDYRRSYGCLPSETLLS